MGERHFAVRGAAHKRPTMAALAVIAAAALLVGCGSGEDDSGSVAAEAPTAEQSTTTTEPTVDRETTTTDRSRTTTSKPSDEEAAAGTVCALLDLGVVEATLDVTGLKVRKNDDLELDVIGTSRCTLVGDGEDVNGYTVTPNVSLTFRVASSADDARVSIGLGSTTEQQIPGMVDVMSGTGDNDLGSVHVAGMLDGRPVEVDLSAVPASEQEVTELLADAVAQLP